MELHQPCSGYRYTSDTMLLYDFILRRGCAGKVLDIGCGCGVLGLLVKRDLPTCQMSAIDIQPSNVALACKNAQHNGIDMEMFEGDFLALEHRQHFDVLISNPPFYHEGVLKTEDAHLRTSRYNSALPLGPFLAHAKRVLKPHGKLLWCYDAKQIGLLLGLLKDEGFTLSALQCVHPKTTKGASLVLFEAKRNSKSLCEVLPPLVVHDSHGYTPEAAAIFQKANTKSLSC